MLHRLTHRLRSTGSHSVKDLSSTLAPWQTKMETTYWVVVSKIFYFHPYLGKIPNLTNIFQMGWNHQLAYVLGSKLPNVFLCDAHTRQYGKGFFAFGRLDCPIRAV